MLDSNQKYITKIIETIEEPFDETTINVRKLFDLKLNLLTFLLMDNFDDPDFTKKQKEILSKFCNMPMKSSNLLCLTADGLDTNGISLIENVFQNYCWNPRYCENTERLNKKIEFINDLVKTTNLELLLDGDIYTNIFIFEFIRYLIILSKLDDAKLFDRYFNCNQLIDINRSQFPYRLIVENENIDGSLISKRLLYINDSINKNNTFNLIFGYIKFIQYLNDDQLKILVKALDLENKYDEFVNILKILNQDKEYMNYAGRINGKYINASYRIALNFSYTINSHEYVKCTSKIKGLNVKLNNYRETRRNVSFNRDILRAYLCGIITEQIANIRNDRHNVSVNTVIALFNICKLVLDKSYIRYINSIKLSKNIYQAKTHNNWTIDEAVDILYGIFNVFKDDETLEDYTKNIISGYSNRTGNEYKFSTRNIFGHSSKDVLSKFIDKYDLSKTKIGLYLLQHNNLI